MDRRTVLIGAGAAAAVGGGAWLYMHRQGGSDGTPPLRIIYNAEEQPAEKNLLAQVLQSQLGEAGVPVTLAPLSSPAYNDAIGRGDFEAALTLWYLDYNDPEGFLTDFYSKAGYRLSKYSDASYDAAYLQGLFAPTGARKAAAFKRAADQLDAAHVWVPLYANDELFLLRPDMAGFRSNAYQYYDYRRVERADIRAATDIEVQTLDPAQAYDLASKHVVTQSYEGLVRLDARSGLAPALARSWRVSDDGREITFDLRDDATFHRSPATSGARRVTAADVKASFERTAGSASPYAYIFDHLDGVAAFRAKRARDVSGLVALSDHQFRIRLTRPVSSMLQWLLAPAASVLPAGLPASYDFSRGSCGTGPFVLRGWNGARADFDAHAEYWGRSGGEGPLARSLQISVMKDASVQLLAYGRQELDLVNVPAALLDAVLAPGGVLLPSWRGSSLRRVSLNNLKFLAFNMQRAPWGKSQALRARVADAIDRKAIVERLLRGMARPAVSVLPPGAFTEARNCDRTTSG